MKTIEILEVHKKNKKYLLLTNDGEYQFSEDIVLKYYLFKGKKILEKEFLEILKDENKNKYLNKLINSLAYVPKSEYEIIKYLKDNAKELTIDEINEIVNKLKSFGYVDDNIYALSVLNHYISNLKGPKFIKNKLEEKKISKDTINNVLSKYKQTQINDNALKIVEKAISTMTKYPIKKQKLLLQSKLYNAGYDSSTIFSIIDDVDFIDESSEQLLKDYQKYSNKFNDKAKIIEALLRKGYEYSKIQNIIKNSNNIYEDE